MRACSCDVLFVLYWWSFPKDQREGLEVCTDGSDRLGKRGSSKVGWRKELALFGAESKISSG